MFFATDFRNKTGKRDVHNIMHGLPNNAECAELGEETRGPSTPAGVLGEARELPQGAKNLKKKVPCSVNTTIYRA